ncbi:MAG TPA: type VI secretion system tube protein Hcp [Pyrinomonadaceae bacterium]|jgi:type VI secretion system secreted protein Hcp
MRKVFLKLNGIEGDSQNERHPGAIEVASFYWGSQQAPSARGGAVAGHGDLTIVKREDKTSPDLVAAALTGQNFQGQLTLEDFSAGRLVRSIVFELQAVAVGAVTGIAAGEVVNLNCRRIRLLHSAKGAAGAGKKETEVTIMKRNLVILSIILAALALCVTSVSAQFNIKLPDIKIKKTVKDPTKNKETNTTDNNDINNNRNNNQTNNNGLKNKTDGKLIYPYTMPTNVPVFLKTKIQIAPVVHNEYWKMKGQSNFSSWVPKMRFSLFYNNEKEINYGVEYYNPDGSVWFSEKLQSSGRNAERTIDYESASPFENGLLDTKSTNGTGVYGFKVTNLDTNEVLIKGKFKVGKFSLDNDGRSKNKMSFYVDHDWLMPYAQIGFHHAFDGAGAIPIESSVWLKGDLNLSDLEGRVFYKGQQIASTKDETSGVSIVEERSSEFAAAYQQADKIWKRYQLFFNNFRMDGNGSYNPEYFPSAHFADKNPGEYTVKVYQNGAPIREFAFTVGADGRFVNPAYASQIPLPYYRFVVPVKFTGAGEKWDQAAWKTDSFYGNPLTGFAIQ